MIPVCTGISYIISASYEPEPEFWKAIPVPVNRNRNSGSVPVSGRIIRFRSYPTCKICRNKLTNCEDFKDHEAYHKANHTMCQLCANLESVIPHFHYKIVFEIVYRSAVRPQFERIWFVKLGSASLFHHHSWTQNPLKVNSVFNCDKCEKTFKKLSHLKRHEVSVHFLKKENCPQLTKAHLRSVCPIILHNIWL